MDGTTLRKLTGGVLGALALASASWASDPATVYVTSDFATNSGIRGVTSGDTVSKLGATGGGDPRYMVFEKNGKEKVLYREFQFGDAADTVTIFDPADWKTPEANLVMGKNISGTAVAGSALFLAHYYNDGKGHSLLTKHDLTDANYKQTGSKNFDDGNAANLSEFVKDVVAWKGVLYVLIERRNSAWPPAYAQSSIVRVDPVTLAETGQVDVGKNASTMVLGNNILYVAVLGGPRNALGDTALVSVDPLTLAKSVVATSPDLPSPYAFDQLGVTADGTLFVTGYYNDAVTWPAPNPCRVFTAAPVTPRRFVERDALAGWVSKGIADPLRNIFWVAHHGTGRGDASLTAYDSTGRKVRAFTENALGGQIYDVAPLKGTVAGGGGSGGGGCSVGTLPALGALLLLLPLAVLRR